MLSRRLGSRFQENMTGPVVDKNAEGARCQLIDLKFVLVLNVSVEGNCYPPPPADRAYRLRGVACPIHR